LYFWIRDDFPKNLFNFPSYFLMNFHENLKRNFLENSLFFWNLENYQQLTGIFRKTLIKHEIPKIHQKLPTNKQNGKINEFSITTQWRKFPLKIASPKQSRLVSIHQRKAKSQILFFFHTYRNFPKQRVSVTFQKA
jgi:hypothetical protein